MYEFFIAEYFPEQLRHLKIRYTHAYHRYLAFLTHIINRREDIVRLYLYHHTAEFGNKIEMVYQESLARQVYSVGALP